jgi:hypothetical protein
VTKPIIIFITIIAAIVLAIAGILVLPWLLIGVGVYFLPGPPKPTITYHEFPFRLEYVQNGKHHILEDTFVCQFDGIGVNEGHGKYRKWKSHFTSGNSEINWKVDSNIEYTFWFCDINLMDHEEFQQAHWYNDEVGIHHRVGNKEYRGCITYDEFKKRLAASNIRIISFEYPKPIKNTFK